MAEVTYKSPGVFANEVDLTQPSPITPTGIPAGIIGTANEGPAFVPITVGSYKDFSDVFGASDGTKFGPLAVNEFLRNAKSLTYIRVLGAGDGKRRSTSTGKVTNAGFIVGNNQVQSNGIQGVNPFAVASGDAGRTHLLGCFMSESAGSTVFSAAGLQNSPTASVIVRGVLMAPDGVLPRLSGNFTVSAQPSDSVAATVNATTLQGGMTGSLSIASQQFTLLLNGHIHTSDNPNVYTCSFDMEDASYFANVLNKDPEKIEEKGHLLYSHYDIHPAIATVTGSGLLKGTVDFTHLGKAWESAAFITSGAAGRDTASTTAPNYETFEDRFTTPKTPFVVSQAFGGTKYNLFRIHSIADGEFSNTKFKISIENIKKSASTLNLFGTFDLIVRKFTDNDYDKVIFEAFRGLSLDPSSDRFVARVIGDQYAYFDFDQTNSSQKLIVAGNHSAKSNFIRIEQSSLLKSSQVPDEALPLGFRGPGHLITSGSNPLADTVGLNFVTDITSSGIIRRAVEPPIPYRESVSVGTSPNSRAESLLYWGTQFTQKNSLTSINDRGLPDATFGSYAKFFPSFDPTNRNFFVENNPGAADSGGTVLDSDKFNNNLFTLENIKVTTGSDTLADVNEWASASYVRAGGISANEANKTRAFSVDDLATQGNRTYAKFTLFIQGGFDGVNAFNSDKNNLLNAAAKREMDDATAQGGTAGPTVAAYRKALDIMGTKSDVDVKILAVPGLRHSSVTDYAIDVVESRFDAIYIMDIEERDELDTVITSSVASSPNVGFTVSAMKNRGLNTSFASAYFPDQVVQDPTTKINVQVPPSVPVLGAFSLNDSVGYPWFAPAGFTRGALESVLYSTLPLNKQNMDDLYDADINPLTSFPGTGIMVFGQKTLLTEQSSLDRVNVRRLLIDIRRKVRNVANRMLFEPNRQETLDKFSSLVRPILQNVQEKSGVDRYKVVIDATTTTQADVENNTLRGKIYIQPTRTAEFIALDFVLTNAGDAFENA